MRTYTFSSGVLKPADVPVPTFGRPVKEQQMDRQAFPVITFYPIERDFLVPCTGDLAISLLDIQIVRGDGQREDRGV